MPRRLRDLLPPYAMRSVRVSVYWRKGRIRGVRVEYGKLPLVRRLFKTLGW
jgi:hypothetical protein